MQPRKVGDTTQKLTQNQLWFSLYLVCAWAGIVLLSLIWEFAWYRPSQRRKTKAGKIRSAKWFKIRGFRFSFSFVSFYSIVVRDNSIVQILLIIS